MSDPLTDLITDVQHNGLRWLSILTLYSIYRKERRNYYLDRRDDALFQNLKTLLEDRGKGECFAENPNSKMNLERELLDRGRIMLSPARIMALFTRRKVTGKLILSRRKTKMNNYLNKLSRTKLQVYIVFTIVNLYTLFATLSGVVDVNAAVQPYMPGIDLVAQLFAGWIYSHYQGKVDVVTAQNASPATSDPNKFIQG